MSFRKSAAETRWRKALGWQWERKDPASQEAADAEPPNPGSGQKTERRWSTRMIIEMMFA